MSEKPPVFPPTRVNSKTIGEALTNHRNTNNNQEKEMQKTKLTIALTMFSVLISANSFAGKTHSGQAVAEAGKASSHAVGSVAHGTIASGQAASAAAAVPLAVAGAAGAVSAKISKDLMDAAKAPVGAPLEISDESVTAGPPPNEALAPAKPKNEI